MCKFLEGSFVQRMTRFTIRFQWFTCFLATHCATLSTDQCFYLHGESVHFKDPDGNHLEIRCPA